MNNEELRKTYPAYTVFICRNYENEITNILPFDYFIRLRKSYDECKKKLSEKRESVFFGWEVKQDKDLYEIACILQKARNPERETGSAITAIEEVISELENICRELS